MNTKSTEEGQETVKMPFPADVLYNISANFD